MKRTEKDLHISSFHLNFAAKCKKQLTNVATFRNYAYICAVVWKKAATSRRAIEL